MKYSGFKKKKKKVANLIILSHLKRKIISERETVPSWDDGFLKDEFLLFSKEVTPMNQYHEVALDKTVMLDKCST